MTNDKELKDEEIEKVSGGKVNTGRCGRLYGTECHEYDWRVEECQHCPGVPRQVN